MFHSKKGEKTIKGKVLNNTKEQYPLSLWTKTRGTRRKPLQISNIILTFLHPQKLPLTKCIS